MWMRIARIKLLLAASSMFLGAVSGAYSQTKKPMSLAELAAYTGADREQRLIAGAKGEGK